MKISELENDVKKELEEEKVSMVKSVVKERIVEIEKVEKLLNKLKSGYQKMLKKSVDEVADEVENGNIRF